MGYSAKDAKAEAKSNTITDSSNSATTATATTATTTKTDTTTSTNSTNGTNGTNSTRHNHQNGNEAKNSSDHSPDYSSPQWTQSLSNLSTPLLNSKLSTLKTQSATLASTLTAKLASSPSGQSLLHIGPSLSTLPPDLQSLLASLEPMLVQVQQYESMNREELIRIVTAGKLVESECRRAENARECDASLMDLVAAEEILAKEFQPKDLTAKKNGDGTMNSQKNDNDAIEEELNYMVSLERVAYTTLHLVDQLQKSSQQVTSSFSSSSGNASNNQEGDNGNGKNHSEKKDPLMSLLPSMDKPLPQDTEKAQFMMKLAPRIRTLERGGLQTLSKQLEQVLHTRVKRNRDAKTTTRITPSSPKSNSFANSNEQELLILGSLFRSFALLGKGSEAESIFARVAIMPIVRSKITLGKMDEGGSRGSCAGLFCLIEDLVWSIKALWGDVLSLVEGMFELDHVASTAGGGEGDSSIEIDLVTAGVWVPIATALMTDPSIQMAIFSPGIASILQANYVALDTFLSELASNLLNPTSSSPGIENSKSMDSIDTTTSTGTGAFNNLDLEEMQLKALYFKPEISLDSIYSSQARLYKHPMTADFSKKWNLPIYYQLRFGEACARLDKAIESVLSEGWQIKNSSGNVLNDSSNPAFEISFFMEVHDIMTWLWRDDVFLRPLSHRFLRGSIQFLGRVLSFIGEGLDGTVKFGVQSGLDKITMNGESSTSVVVDKSYCWSERVGEVAAVSWNLTILENYIRHEYVNTISNIVSPSKSNDNSISESESSSEIKTLIGDALVEATEGVYPIIDKSWNDVIVNLLITKCSTPLSLVRGVAATYRMTNRPPPTQASPFVATILSPLKEFTTNFSNHTPPQVGNQWKRNVVSSVAEKYCNAVSELTETVQRTEEALKNRKTRRTIAGGMSDGEKVKLQLLLDQREFCNNVEEIGVDVESIEYVKKLVSLTESAEALLSK